jgi:hypothetical protein
MLALLPLSIGSKEFMKKVEEDTTQDHVQSRVDLVVRAIGLSGLLEAARLVIARLSRKIGKNSATKPPQQKGIMAITSLEFEQGQPYHLPDDAKEVGFERLPNGKIRILYEVPVGGKTEGCRN